MAETPESWLTQAGYPDITRTEAVTSGCINAACRLTLADGQTLFLKSNPQASTDMFAAEAAGLAALAERKALRIPNVLHANKHFILMEDLGAGARKPDYWQTLGAGLSRLHRQPAKHFGFSSDNYCGATPQANALDSNGYQFFAQKRILALASSCLEQGLLQAELMTKLDRIAESLPQWISEMPAVLIHGDLWSGNIHCCEDGAPALVDPAAYWGWAEADLAMTRLFGGFPAEFYDSYRANSALAEDWEQRIPLYNLYHLLNHLLLFGGSYLDSVADLADCYSRQIR